MSSIEQAPLKSPRSREKSPKQTERFQARRRQLAALTMKMVREKGFDSVSVNELAERAEMSIGGLYRYIKTKSDLLELICDEINLGLHARMLEAAAAARGIEQKLLSAFQVYWNTCWDSADPILTAYREWQSLPSAARQRYREEEIKIAEYFGDLIRAGIVSDEFRAVDERILASEMIFLAQMRALKSWVFRGVEQSAVLDEHWKLIIGRLRK